VTIRINMSVMSAYAAGVVTAPVWIYIFRKPLTEHVFIPILADEDFDEPLRTFMLNRNTLQDKKKTQADKGKP
jgi:hypothetical protein